MTDPRPQPANIRSGPGWRREDTGYVVDGCRVAADLYLPAAPPGPGGYPAVLTGPGFAGVKEMLIEAFGTALAAAGIACLSIDYRRWGASEGVPRQDLDPALQVADLRAGLDHLERRADIDPRRLGVWGTSMAGAHAVTLAATDRRVAAAVAIIPFLRPPAPRPDQRWMLGAVLRDAVRRLTGRPAGTVPVFAERPGMRAIMTSDGGWEWMQGVTGSAPNYRNLVTLRSMLALRRYEPDKLLARITAPILFVAARDDTITPAEPIRDAARAVKAVSDLDEYPGSHFELFGAHLPQVVDATVAWLRMHLAERGRARDG